MPLDLDAYCTRIGYDGPREPTLDALRVLQARHIASIPFEAIDVYVGHGIDLTPDAVDDKLLRRRRGGYCFEQNTLFLRVLHAFGFRAEGRLARVLWGRPPEAPPQARTHMVLRVQIDGVPWLADAGFGSAVPTAPLRWDAAGAQPTPHGRYRLAVTTHGRRVDVELGTAWSPIYQISDEPPEAADYVAANWYTSTHPDSPFRRDLMAARSAPGQRAALLGNRLTLRRVGGGTHTQHLDRIGLEDALREVFGLPVDPAWRPYLERVVAEASECSGHRPGA